MSVRRPATTALSVAGGAWLVLLLAAAAGAQGLGDAAAEERERRGGEPEADARVYTNEDLSDSVAGEEGDGQAAPGDDEGPSERADVAVPPPGPARDESDEEFRERVDRERAERALQEREWRARFAQARARVREAEARGWRDVVRTEFYQGIPVQMKVKEFVETDEFRQAKKDLADLQEQFRRTGLPPGWSRE